MNIEELSHRELLDYFESEVRIHHYDPVETPPRAPFSLDELRQELLLRLDFPDQEP